MCDHRASMDKNLLALSVFASILVVGCSSPPAPSKLEPTRSARFETTRAGDGLVVRGLGPAVWVRPDELLVQGTRGEAVQRIGFAGASASARLVGESRLRSAVYYPGQEGDRGSWAAARVVDLYAGVDLTLRVVGGSLKFDWWVAPGADPGRIRLDVANPVLGPGGELLAGGLRVAAPLAYQEVEGRRSIVPCRYALDLRGVRLELGHYDRTRPLVIDPTLLVGTYLGGAGFDDARSVCSDGAGGVWVSGLTQSSDFPVVGAVDDELGGSNDAFVAHYDAGGTLLSSTYIGGSGEETPKALTPSTPGGVWLVGMTRSADFPMVNAFDSTFQGTDALQEEGFVVRLGQSGGALVSSFLGGNSGDSVNCAAPDGQGGVWVAGITYSTQFPLVNAFQDSYQGGSTDGFVAHVTAGGALSSSSYLGGNDTDYLNVVCAGEAGSVWAGGYTESRVFPLEHAWDTTSAGEFEGFVAKVDGTGALSRAGFLGGSANDRVLGLAHDGATGVWIVGRTTSSDFPTQAPFDAGANGDEDAFVVHVTGGEAPPSTSTYLGGASYDEAVRVEPDGAGGAWVGGQTWSNDFPTRAAFDTTYGGSGDAWLVRFGSTNELLFSTYLGGTGADQAQSLTSDGLGGVWAVGTTSSTNFPLVDAFDTRIHSSEAFATHVAASGALRSSTYLGGTASDTAATGCTDHGGGVWLAGSTQALNWPTYRAAQPVYAGGGDATVARVGPSRPGVGTSLVLYRASDRQVGYWTTNNGAITGWVSATKLATGWGVFGYGDVDRDGREDFGVTRNSDRSVGWYLWNGSAVTGWQSLSSKLADGWTPVGCLDIDRDGHTDLAVFNGTTRLLGVYRLNGGTITGWVRLTHIPTGWAFAGFADLNLDAQADICIRRQTDGSVGCYTLSGSTVSGWLALGTKIPTGWAYVGWGDMNADGKADLLIEQTATRRIGAYLLDGVVVTGWKPVAAVGAGWTPMGLGRFN